MIIFNPNGNPENDSPAKNHNYRWKSAISPGLSFLPLAEKIALRLN